MHTHTHTHTHTRTHTICCSAVVGTGERICNSLFGYQSSLVHYVICPPRSHTSLLPTINGGAHSKMDEACAEGLFGDFQGRGGEGHALGVGDTLWGGDMFTSPDTSKKIAMISSCSPTLRFRKSCKSVICRYTSRTQQVPHCTAREPKKNACA